MVKSSAIKILTVKTTSENNYNYLNFLYYVLNSAKFENQGHARHYISIVQKQTAYIPTSRKELFFIQNIINKLDVLITLHQRYKDEQIFKELNYPYCITNAWEQRELENIVNRFDNLRVPVAESLRKKGNIPYYGANGIQGYVDGYTHNGEFILIAEDGANDLNNYPVRYVNGKIWVNNHAHVIQSKQEKSNNLFISFALSSADIKSLIVGGSRSKLTASSLMQIILIVPLIKEQQKIGIFLNTIESLLTLHQRKFLTKFSPKIITKGGIIMLSDISCNDFFYSFFEQWIKVYKEGAVRAVTMKKYYMTLSWVKKIAPTLKLSELTRITYQQLLNEYALSHERQTTMDFHHQLKGAIMDAVDDGLIAKDPTRKAIIKGKQPKEKKIKYLSQFELHNLLSVLDLKGDINWDWLILLVAKTGIRFSEALAITPADFDFSHQTLSISRTWDYKGNGGFLPTKNHSSVRKIQIDWQTVVQFSELVKNLPNDKPIFVKDKKIYNSTINTILARHCKEAKIPIIAIHGLRHTHASLLLFAGVSIASVARRLGHASMTTTQKTYLHIIQELENKDIDLVMRSISGLS